MWISKKFAYKYTQLKTDNSLYNYSYINLIEKSLKKINLKLIIVLWLKNLVNSC